MGPNPTPFYVSAIIWGVTGYLMEVMNLVYDLSTWLEKSLLLFDRFELFVDYIIQRVAN